jgi:hypothetical protein
MISLVAIQHDLIQAKYFGRVRDDIELDECSVNQLKLKASGGESSEAGEDSLVAG